MLWDQLHAAGRSLWPSHMEVAEVRRRLWLTFNPAPLKVCKHNVVSQLCHQRLHPWQSPPGWRLCCSVDLGADIWTGSPCLTWKSSGLVGEPDYWYLDREQARRPSCPHLEGATTALYRWERPLTIGKTRISPLESSFCSHVILVFHR